MPFITVKLLAGRDQEQKQEIVTGVTKVVADACRIPQERVHVFIEDMAHDTYACGGVLAKDRNDKTN